MNAANAAQFGPSLARRVAARTGVRRHAGNARAIGVVSRSAVGFGQAIGRSRQTRPNVTPESLTSPRLRPPAGWWRTLATPEVDAPEPTWTRPTWTDDLVPPTRHTRQPAPAAPAGAGRQGPAPSPAAPAATEAPTTGLGRLDVLRSLIASGRAPDGSSISPDVLHQQRPDDDLPVERVATERIARTTPAVASHADSAPTEPAARHALTEAGPATGPGALGRRVQPEPVAPGTTAQRAPGGIPTSAPAPPPAPAGPPGDTAAGAAGNTAPIRRSPARPERGPSRAAGEVSTPNDSGPAWYTRNGGRAPENAHNGNTPARRAADGSNPAAEAGHGAPAAAPRADHGAAGPASDRGRPQPGSADDRGLPTSAHDRHTPAPVARARTAQSPASESAGQPRWAGDRAPADRRDAATPPPATRADGRPARAADEGGAPAPATHDRAATQPSWAVEHSAPPTGAHAGRPADTPSVTPPTSAHAGPPADTPSVTAPTSAHAGPPADTPSGAPPTSAHAGRPADTPSGAPPAPVESDAADLHDRLGEAAGTLSRAADLRVQRLITAEPAGQVAPPPGRPRPAAAARLGVRDGESEFGDTLVARPLARYQADRHTRPAPALPGAADGRQPVRRVTLPRAMSRVHRPDPLIPGAVRDRADVVGTGADSGHDVRPPTPQLGTATADALLTHAGVDARGSVVRRASTTNPRARGDDRFDDLRAAEPPTGGSPRRGRRAADQRTSPRGVDRPDRPANGLASARGVDPLGHRDATDSRRGVGDHPRRRAGVERGITGRAAAVELAVERRERPDVVRPAQQRAAADAGAGSDRPIERRVSVRPATDAAAPVVRRAPTPPRRRSSIVDNGVDVLRRVLSVPTPPPPSVASADGLPVAPAARVGPESHAAGADPAIQPLTTHAAGQARSDSGAALAERFMTELSHAVRAQPTPLPTTFRPMADQIAGRRAVMLATDTASRRALRSVGKRAATVGDTIHVDTAASQLVDPSKRITEVIAHELTHIAHPSPAPRFFDDVDESPEERRAEAVARMIARAPLAPAASTLVAPHTSARRAPVNSMGADVVRRSPAPGSTPGTIRADELAASVSRARSPEAVRRQHTVAVPAQPQPSTAPAEPPPAVSAPAPSLVVPAGENSESAAIADRDEEFRALLERNLDVVLRRVEDHILIDIERRGGRAWRGF